MKNRLYLQVCFSVTVRLLLARARCRNGFVPYRGRRSGVL